MNGYAIILAGGKGERLRPFTNDRPKPMVEVGKKPILSYQLEQLRQSGVDTVVFACSYKKEFLQDHIGKGQRYGVKALYSIEDTPLGRGGGIKQAMSLLPQGWENVIVTNGDNLWKLNLTALMKKHLDNNALITMVVSPLKSPYGIVEFNQSDQVQQFREKPFLPHWINSGVYVFNKELYPLLPDIGDHETETFPMLPKDRFLVFKSEDYWRGVDTAKDLTEASQEVLEQFA